MTETIEMSAANSSNKLWHRRDVIKLLGATAITGPAILRGTTANAAGSKVIKIGHVSPQTGALAPFAEADAFILDQIRTVLAKGITNRGVTYKVQIISKDSQSNINRASEVAADLILKDKVDLLVASGTPDKGFTWTYHFFWGVEDVIASFFALWNSVETNKVVGVLFSNDEDGNALGDAKIGFPPAIQEAGYKLIDTGRFQPFSDDYGSQISAFSGCDCSNRLPFGCRTDQVVR